MSGKGSASRPPEGSSLNEPIPLLYTIPNFDTAGSGAALLNVVARLDRRRFAPSICVLRRGGRLEGGGAPPECPFSKGSSESERGRSSPCGGGPAKPRRPSAERGSRSGIPTTTSTTTPNRSCACLGASAWVYTKKNMSWNRRWYLRSLLATRIAAQNWDMIQKSSAAPCSGGAPPGFRPESKRSAFGRTCRRAWACVRSSGSPPTKSSSGASRSSCLSRDTGRSFSPRGASRRAALARRPRGRSGIRLAAERDVADFGLESRVAFLGEIRDVPAFLAELDVFVLPTWDEWRMEGRPVALLEAMSSGRACVASDIPGSRDAVQNGQRGSRPPRDPDALAEAIDRLGRNAGQRRGLGQAAAPASSSSSRSNPRFEPSRSSIRRRCACPRPRRHDERERNRLRDSDPPVGSGGGVLGRLPPRRRRGGKLRIGSTDVPKGRIPSGPGWP